MILQRQDINSFDSIRLDDISFRILHDLLLFIYSGYSSILKDKPFDLTYDFLDDAPQAAPAPAASEVAKVEAAADRSDAAAAAAASPPAAASTGGCNRSRFDLLRQLYLAAEKYGISELKSKVEREISLSAPVGDNSE